MIPCGETILLPLHFFYPPLSSCITAVLHRTSIVAVFVVAPTTADRLFDCVRSRTLHLHRIVSRTHNLCSRVSDQLPSLSGKSIAKATPTSAPWTDPKPTAPSVPSPIPFGCAITANPQKDMLNWLQVHAVPPSTVWLRPSSQQTSPTADSTLTEKLRSFYFDSSRDTRTTTPANRVSSAFLSPS